MAQNYDFLRTFTFDGKETKHLFQIAKVNIPFLSKENEMFQVGNTDGQHFLKTRLSPTTLTIDGFMIKDNSKMNIYDTKDELVRIINSDEPKQLIFDMFPDRYFNAIYTGSQEYDATDPNYTPVTLVFDVPDGLAHSINPTGFTNVFTEGTNLVLDSEYNKIDKYLKPWVRKLPEKYENSNIVEADFRTGVPLNFEGGETERWLTYNTRTRRYLPELEKGSDINFSVFARVKEIDAEDQARYAGRVILEEWNTKESKIIKRHIVEIPKVVKTSFVEYGAVVSIENEETDAISLQYGFNGKNLVSFSKPMMSLLPPIGEKVVEPIVGATLYSNSLDFGDYDYSGRANLMPNLDFSKLSGTNYMIQTPAPYIKDGGTYFVLDTSDASAANTSRNVFIPFLGRLEKGATYMVTIPMMVSEDFGTDYVTSPIYPYNVNDGSTTTRGLTMMPNADCRGKWQLINKAFTVPSNMTDGKFAPFLHVYQAATQTGKLYIGYDIKIEKVTSTSDTATPYQPNLLDAPYYLSKVALGKNIRRTDTGNSLPRTTTEYQCYVGNIEGYYEANQDYVITMKATKPDTQTFGLYLLAGSQYAGSLMPVEGLTDTWQLTFRPTKEMIDDGVRNQINIFQLPQSTKGEVKIEWIKLEKGDTRTPNIDYYKYRGLYTYPSTNPKDYSWTYDPSYYKAISYEPTEEGVSDAIVVNNQGTYKAYPTFTFKMNGENGLVGLLNQNGAVLQFGNPEDVDGRTAVRTESGLDENFWGNTLNPNIAINTGFKSVYPNMNNNPATPNLIQGTFDMKKDPNSVAPVFTGVGDIGVWHGPTMVMNIQAPTNNDRTGEVAAHVRFGFDNYNKGQRGRIEFSIFDELGNPSMTAIVRDSSEAGNQLILECWYKGQRLLNQGMDRNVFNKAFYEINMDRRGSKLIWRLVQIKSLKDEDGYSQANIDKEYKFTWILDAPDTTKWTKLGIWQMRYSNKYVVLENITDAQVRWEKTPYYQDIKNYFREGDLVEIDTQTRELYINGSINNELNIVGNQWEQFRLELGETTIQPIVSSWANMADVTAELREAWL